MELLNTCFELAKFDNVRLLAWYSHIIPIFISLLLSFVVVRYGQNKNKAILFAMFGTFLSLWLVGDLVTWVTNNYYLVAAFWSYLDYANILFYLFILCFAAYDLSENRILRRSIVVFGTLATLPPLLVTLAGQAVFEFDEPNCEMIGNDFLAVYKLGFEWVVIAVIAILTIFALAKRRQILGETKRILLTTFSLIGFLAIFSGSEFVSTYTEIYEINLYALFTLPIFILLLAVSIFEFRLFRLQLDSINMVKIVFIIFLFIAVANLFIAEQGAEFIMSATGTIITLGFGALVIRGADREAAQRQEITRLARNLEAANMKLKLLDKQKSEFVSIASHQLRSPLTSIRGYASLILEGTYGVVTKKLQEPLSRIDESARYMAYAIEDYLNVSRIESGNMKYSYLDFNLKDEVSHICDDLRHEAVRRGLILHFRTDLHSQGVTHADVGKTIQIVQNLIQNAIKYTPQGTIVVRVSDDLKQKKLFVTVSDTGMGMSKETLYTIFQKFRRADNANTVDVSGTGLGLYVALKMTEAMGGTITADSEGEGKGSTFTAEFPLVL